MCHWRWAGVVASSVLTAGLMTLSSVTLAAWHHPAAPLRSGYVGFLIAIPLIAVPVWQLSRIELRAARCALLDDPCGAGHRYRR